MHLIKNLITSIINISVDKDSSLIFERYLHNEPVNEGLKDMVAAGALGLASLAGPNNNVQAGSPPPITRQAAQNIPIDYNDMFNYISTSEGKGKPGRPGYRYNDSKGLPTIGIGHLITKDSPNIFRKLFGNKVDIKGTLSGRKPMSDSMMLKLFQTDVQKKIDTAQRLVPAFDTYPQYVKNAIVDGLYRGDLGPKTRGFINSGDFKAAAKEYLNHNDYRKSVASNKAGKPHGVKGRMERNRDAFLKYSGDKSKEVSAEPGTRNADEQAIIVRQGDTLSAIAKRQGITLQQLLKVNPQIKDVNRISIGQEIKLP